MSTRVEGPAPRHGTQAVLPLLLPILLPILLLCTGACARFPAKPTGSAWGPVTTDANRAFTPGADRDGDGIGDEREQALRSNPDARDSDGDASTTVTRIAWHRSALTWYAPMQIAIAMA
jgi:hypothetical protein